MEILIASVVMLGVQLIKALTAFFKSKELAVSVIIVLVFIFSFIGVFAWRLYTGELDLMTPLSVAETALMAVGFYAGLIKSVLKPMVEKSKEILI